MAATIVRYDTTEATIISGTSITCAMPTGTKSGRLLIATISTRGGVDSRPLTPTGWTQHEIEERVTNSWSIVYTRIADGTEGADLTLNCDPLGSWTTVLMSITAFSNVDTTAPINATAVYSPGSSSSLVVPAITPTVNGSYVYAFVSQASTTASATEHNWDAATPYVKFASVGGILDSLTHTASYGGFIQTTAALQGTETVDSAVNGSYSSIVVALTPADSPEDLYRDLVMSHSPAAYWRLEETSGTTVAAEVGPTLTVTGTPDMNVQGAVGRAFKFGGASSYEYLTGTPTGLGYATGSDLTLKCWASFTQTNVIQGMISLRTTSTADRHYNLFQYGTVAGQDITMDLGSSGTRWQTGYIPPTDSDLHMYVFTYRASTNVWILYVDGVAVNSTTIAISGSAALPGQIALAILGGSSTTSINGKLDEVAIFFTALSAAEIQALYDARPPIPGIKVHNGTTTVDKPIRVYDGVSRPIKPLKRWDGYAWV